jgi:hypothetical protein
MKRHRAQAPTRDQAQRAQSSGHGQRHHHPQRRIVDSHFRCRAFVQSQAEAVRIRLSQQGSRHSSGLSSTAVVG